MATLTLSLITVRGSPDLLHSVLSHNTSWQRSKRPLIIHFLTCKGCGYLNPIIQLLFTEVTFDFKGDCADGLGSTSYIPYYVICPTSKAATPTSKPYISSYASILRQSIFPFHPTACHVTCISPDQVCPHAMSHASHLIQVWCSHFGKR